MKVLSECCTNLERLNISCTQVSYEGLNWVVNSCPYLRDLDLCYSAIGSQEKEYLPMLAEKITTRLTMVQFFNVYTYSSLDWVDFCT